MLEVKGVWEDEIGKYQQVLYDVDEGDGSRRRLDRYQEYKLIVI